jgi:uncharacterized membrane protein
MNTIIPLLCAILSPFILGLMNILDKFVITKKVKRPMSFVIIAGLVNLSLGLLLAVFLDWSILTFKTLLFPALAGLLFGSQFFLYYRLLRKEDVSNVIGLVYVYPVVVAVLSFLFLEEQLSLFSYLGMALVLLGVLRLTIKKGSLRNLVIVWSVLPLMLVTAFAEFFIKQATTALPVLNGIAINHVIIGLVIMLGLVKKDIRSGVAKEFKNLKWALLNESLTFLGILTLYFAMNGLPATIVASIAATQPLTVLTLEYFANKAGFNISKNKDFKGKILPLLLIVGGVVLLYLPEALK